MQKILKSIGRILIFSRAKFSNFGSSEKKVPCDFKSSYSSVPVPKRLKVPVPVLFQFQKYWQFLGTSSGTQFRNSVPRVLFRNFGNTGRWTHMPKLLGFRNLCSTILTYHFLELFSKVYICLSTMIVLFYSHSCYFQYIVAMLRVLETWTLTIIRELNVSNSAYQSPVISLKYIDNSRCLYCALASGNFYFVLIKVSLFWPNRQFILVGTVLGWELRQKPQK